MDYKPGMPDIGKIEEVLRLAKDIEHPIKQGFYLFGHITREQWFNDGNKRTAQLVANHAFVQNNAGIMPGGLTMEKTREIEERNRKWLGLE